MLNSWPYPFYFSDEEKEEEQVEAIGLYSSIFNSRSDHMIMVEDHSSIENEV